MKFISLLALPALAFFASAAPATNDAALTERADTITVQHLIHSLTTEVKQYTGNMNKTLSALPENASADERKSAVNSINADLKSITAAFHTSNVELAAKKPTLGDLPKAVLGQLNGKPIVLAKLLLPLLQELNPALESVLVTLSLGEVYVALQPLLTTELPTLVTGLSGLVSGLLAALSPLLSALGGILGPLLLSLGL